MDNTKARRMGADGLYRPVSDRTGLVNCQEVLMRDAVEAAARIQLPRQRKKGASLLRRLLGRE